MIEGIGSFQCVCAAASGNPSKKQISDSLQENSRSFGEQNLATNSPMSLVNEREFHFCHVMAWRLLKRSQNLGAKLSAANFEEREIQETVTMTIALPKKATLGDLIAAVTDEISPLTRSSLTTNILVSYIVKDLFAKRLVRLRRRRVLKIA